MANFEIPNSAGQITTAKRSETQGQILESFSIDINNPFGKIKPSRKLTKVLDTDPDTFQALAVYKADGTARYYAITDDDVYVCSTTNDPTDLDNWDLIDVAFPGIFDESDIGSETDAVVFNDLLLISRSQDILSWNGSTDDPDWWTTVSKGGDTGAALTAGYPHIMHVHRGGQETLFVTDKNFIRYANTTAGHSNITLGADQIACAVDSGVDAVWVGTYSTSSDKAYVYEVYVGQELDGTPVANRAFKIDARAVLSLAVLDNIPYIITERGNLQAFNGSGFVTVAQLPFAGSSFVLDGMRIGNISDDSEGRPVHPKGMRAHNESIFININTESENVGFSQSPYAKNSPSGIWEYNTITGQLHHRYAFSEATTNKGAKVCNYSGPLLIVDTPYTFLMAGTEIEDGTAGLFMEADSQYGYFTTPEITSRTVTEAHPKLYIKKDGSGTVDVLFRTEKQDNQYCTFALQSANVLNTTDTVTVAVGDEVTIIDGSLHGARGLVTEILTSLNVTSLTLDTDIGTAGNTGTAEITNFKSIGDPTTEGSYLSYGSDTTSTWVQYKVHLTGDVEIRHLLDKGNAKNEA